MKVDGEDGELASGIRVRGRRRLCPWLCVAGGEAREEGVGLGREGVGGENLAEGLGQPRGPITDQQAADWLGHFRHDVTR